MIGRAVENQQQVLSGKSARHHIEEGLKASYNGKDADQFEADIDIYMRPDGTLASQPTIVAARGPSPSISHAMAESAARAVVQCQAYAFLPKQQYDTWKYIGMTFSLKDML